MTEKSKDSKKMAVRFAKNVERIRAVINRKLCILLAIVLGPTFLIGCGNAGEKSGGSSASSGATDDVVGTIVSSTGTTAEFEGWGIVLVNAATGETRLSGITGDGAYQFNEVDLSAEYTLVMINTDYRLSSVLSMISAENTGKVFQYFRLEDATIPRIVYRGSFFEFSNPDAVEITERLADDTDGDGIPDGMESATALVAREGVNSSSRSDSLSTSSEDTDLDGIPNVSDPDIDGDGLVNWFDEDDDNNGTLDVFDLDANGDLVVDSSQTIGDHYFGDGVEYIAVQYFTDADSAQYLKFVIKVDLSEVTPSSITINGSETLFDEALVVARSDTGVEEATDIWDLTLSDDGSSFDDAAGDGIYARKIKLKNGKSIRTLQTVFIGVNIGAGTSLYTRNFPYLFSDISVGSISFTYATSTNVVTQTGSPFGSISSYLWQVKVLDENGSLAETSGELDGSTTTYTLDSSNLEDDGSYTATVFAQSLSKAGNLPAYNVESAENSL